MIAVGAWHVAAVAYVLFCRRMVSALNTFDPRRDLRSLSTTRKPAS